MSCTNFLLKFNAQDFFFCSNLSKIIVNFVLAECRSSSSEVFLGKGVLKFCNKFTGEHPCRSVISIKLQSNTAIAKKSRYGMDVLL